MKSSSKESNSRSTSASPPTAGSSSPASPAEILVYENLEAETPTVFADLRGDVYDNGDRGLLGIELDPKFDEEGHRYVYALYT